MRALSFDDLQRRHGVAPAPTPRAAMPTRDGAEVRAEMITAGVLRASRSLLRQLPFRVSVEIDDAGLDAAARTIFANTAADALAAVIEHADPRIAERLEAPPRRAQGDHT